MLVHLNVTLSELQNHNIFRPISLLLMITKITGPLLLFLDQALSSHEMLEVQGFQAGTHAGGL